MDEVMREALIVGIAKLKNVAERNSDLMVETMKLSASLEVLLEQFGDEVKWSLGDELDKAIDRFKEETG